MLSLLMTTPSFVAAASQSLVKSATSARAPWVLPAGSLRVVRAVAVKTLQLPPSDEVVEEVVQETMRRAIEQGRSELAYLIGIAKHVAIDALRLRAKQRQRSSELPSPDGSGAFPEAIVVRSTGESELARKQLGAQLLLAIAALPEQQRQVLVARELHGEAYEALAARMGVPVGTIATWISRARSSVAAQLKESQL